MSENYEPKPGEVRRWVRRNRWALWHRLDPGVSRRYTSLCRRLATCVWWADMESCDHPPLERRCSICHRRATIAEARPIPRPLERPERPLPTIESLTGSDPEFTGDMTTEEYIRDMRGGPEGPEEGMS